MQFNVNKIVPEMNFYVYGTSYVGKPKSNTAMYITKKIERLLQNTDIFFECLIFAESNIDIPSKIFEKNAVVLVDNPQLEFAKFANQFAFERFEIEKKIRYKMMDTGYWISDDSVVGENVYIEPGCVIGPDVRIGDNAVILAGSVIRRAIIGNNFYANEHVAIGTNGFTIAEDEEGNQIRIPTLGKVMIGNNVEIGAHDNISCGSCEDTIIEDNVKIDALVHIGHDAYLHKNVRITAGGIIGGFDTLGEHAYVGINAVLRNRINIGERAVIGMGATVTKSIESNITVIGNPAREMKK